MMRTILLCSSAQVAQVYPWTTDVGSQWQDLHLELADLALQGLDIGLVLLRSGARLGLKGCRGLCSCLLVSHGKVALLQQPSNLQPERLKHEGCPDCVTDYLLLGAA